MDYLTDTDRVIFLAGGVGLVVGLAINAQELAFDQWLNQEWLGWDRAISRGVVSAIVWALILSALAFITILYEPAKPLSAISRSVTQLGIWIALVSPSATRAGLWLTDRIVKRIRPDSE